MTILLEEANDEVWECIYNLGNVFMNLPKKMPEAQPQPPKFSNTFSWFLKRSFMTSFL